MTKAGGESAKAMKQLNVSFFDSKGNIKNVEVVMQELSLALSKLGTDAERVKLINMIGGKTQAKTLQKLLQGMVTDTGQLTEEYKQLKAEIEKAPSEEALAKMSEIMTDNLGGDIKKMTSAISEGVMALIDQYDDELRGFIQRITEAIKGLTEKLKSMTPEQKEALASFIKWTIILPPVMLVFGKLISVFGSAINGVKNLKKGFDKLSDLKSAVNAVKGSKDAIGAVGKTMGKASGSTGLLTKGLTFAVKALSRITPAGIAWTLAGTAVVATGKAIYNGLQKEVVPTVDLFADKVTYTANTVNSANSTMGASYASATVKISEGTQKAVQAYLDLDKGVSGSMFNMFINQTHITEAIATSMQTKFTEMATMTKNAINTKATESITQLTGLLTATSVLTEEQQAQALAKEQEFYNQKIHNVTETENAILQILKTAGERGTELTKVEYENLQALQEQLREFSIKALSDQEVEAQVILERMSGYQNRLTTEMVSENITKLIEQKTKAIEQANAQCDEQIRIAERAFRETGSITEEQRNEIVAKAKEQKDGIIKEAEETHDKALEKIKELGEDTIKDVDTSTGKIMSTWDKLMKKWDNWFPKKKKFESESVETKTVVTQERKEGRTFGLPEAMSKLKNTSIPVDLKPQGLNMRNYKTGGGLYNSISTDSKKMKSSKSGGNNDLLGALVQQNELLTQILMATTGLNSAFNVSLNLDGRQIAKTSARYIDEEIVKMKNRKSRLGGSYGL